MMMRMVTNMNNECKSSYTPIDLFLKLSIFMLLSFMFVPFIGLLLFGIDKSLLLYVVILLPILVFISIIYSIKNREYFYLIKYQITIDENDLIIKYYCPHQLPLSKKYSCYISNIIKIDDIVNITKCNRSLLSDYFFLFFTSNFGNKPVAGYLYYPFISSKRIYRIQLNKPIEHIPFHYIKKADNLNFNSINRMKSDLLFIDIDYKCVKQIKKFIQLNK
jgi:hypothetical protein